MDKADFDAELVYKEKGCVYRSLTFISRLFRRSHYKRICYLQISVIKDMNALDPVKQLADLKKSDTNAKNYSNLQNLANNFFKINDYEHCIETLEELKTRSILDQYNDEQVVMIGNIAENYLKNNELDLSIETIHLLGRRHHDNTTMLTKDKFSLALANYYFENGDLKNTIKLIKYPGNFSNERRELRGKVVQKYFDQGNNEKAEKIQKILL